MVLKEFPNGVTQGQQYNIGEKPTVTLYAYINHHVGTPKQKQTGYYTVFFTKCNCSMLYGTKYPIFNVLSYYVSYTTAVVLQ